MKGGRPDSECLEVCYLVVQEGVAEWWKRTGKCAIAVLTDDVDRIPDLGVGSVVFANQPARCKAIVQLPAVHAAQPVLVVSDSKQRQT